MALRYKYLSLIFLIILACADDTPRSSIPYAPVYFTVDLNGLDFSLKEGLSYKIFKESDRRFDYDKFGYAGLLVVSDATGSTIYAYDLCCPYEANKNIRITPREDGKAECPGCNSLFVTMFGYTELGYELGMGTNEKGPAAEPLKSYRVRPLRPGVYNIIN